MRLWLDGWRAYVGCERRYRELLRSYRRMADAYYRAAVDLEREQQRANRAFLAATAPCESCVAFCDERDAALHEADGLRDQLDREAAARILAEHLVMAP